MRDEQIRRARHIRQVRRYDYETAKLNDPKGVEAFEAAQEARRPKQKENS